MLYISDTEPVVFFSVGLSKMLTVLPNAYIVFNKVFVDNRRSYHCTSGIYMVPVTGLYEINYHVVTRAGTTIYLKLKRNGRLVKLNG